MRLTLPLLESLDFFITASEQQAQFVDRRRVRIYEGDPLLLWRLRPNLRDALWDLNLVSTNAQHLRYDRPVGPKPSGTYRILCVGDSVTFGYRVPLVFPKRPREYEPSRRSYPALLEQALRAASPGRAIEVIPLAVPGYSSHQGLAWLRRDIGWLQPDLVIACFGWNDISRRAVSDRDAMRTDRLSVLARDLVARSQALLHFRRWLDARRAAKPAEAPSRNIGVMRVSREAYLDNLMAVAALARSRGARVALLGPVYRDRVSYPPEAVDIGAHRAALKSAAQGARIPYLEIPELTESHYPENERLFGEHIHPNHRGHRLIAERLGAFLGREGLLGDLRPPAPPAETPPAAAHE